MTIRTLARVAATVLLAIVVPTAFADPPTVWTLPGGAAPTNPAVGQLIQVTPYSVINTVAQQLAQRPVGARGLYMTGFTEDLTTRDLLKRAGKPAVPYVRSPWIDQGIAVVHSRANSWLAKLAAKGATVNFVVVQSNATLQSSSFAQYGATGWKSISEDIRFPALKTALGATSNFVAEMTSATSVREHWNSYFAAKIDTALAMSIGASVTHYFPAAKVVSTGRYVLGTASAMTPAREGAAFGTNDQPQFYGQGSISQPFPALATLVADAQSVAAASGRRSVPSVTTPAWPGAGGSQSVLAGTTYWDELVYHLALAGSPYMLMDRGTIGSADLTALTRVRADLVARTLGATFTPHPVTAAYDHSLFVVSSGLVGQTVHERVSFLQGTGIIRVTYDDATSVIISPDSGATGAWVDHPLTQEIAFVQLASQDPLPETYSVLYDAAPTSNFESPVNGAATYLIVYQDSADPNARATGIIDPALVLAEVAHQISLHGESPWGVLDFEYPFNDVLSAGPADPLYASTLQSLIDTIRAVKLAYPATKWTYFGMPCIDYHPIGKDWGQVAEVDRPSLYQDYADIFGPLMDEMDWFMPSVYDKYERALGAPNSYSLPLVAEREFRKCSVYAIRYYFESTDRAVPRILPAVSPWFMSDDQAHMYYIIPGDEFREEQVNPCIEAGASGVAVWCSMDYFLSLATWTGVVVGQYGLITQAALRVAFAHDYLNDVDPAAVVWNTHEVRDAIIAGMNQNLSDALLAAYDAQSFVSP